MIGECRARLTVRLSRARRLLVVAALFVGWESAASWLVRRAPVEVRHA